MRRLVLLLVLLFCSALGQSPLLNVRTLADITGTGAAVQLCSSCGAARWVQITTPTTNGSVVRWGDSNVTASRGAQISPGGGQYLQAAGAPYQLPNIYVYIANGDTVSVTYGGF